MNVVDRDVAVRAHLDYILRDYALQYASIDHVEYTRWLVSDILSRNLKMIPTASKTTIILPEEPWVGFCRIFKLDELKPWDQKWTADSSTSDYMRLVLPKGGKRLRTTRIWDEDDTWDRMADFRPHSPPILTRKAIRETPVLGIGRYHQSQKLPKSIKDLKRIAEGPTQLAVQPLELDEKIDRDTLLQARLEIDKPAHEKIMELVKQLPLFKAIPPGGFISSSVKAFLERHSPPPETASDMMLSPPMFPRHRRKHIVGPQERKLHRPDLSKLLKGVPPLEVKEVEELHIANAKIVDGWNILAEAYVPSSPTSTPSLVPGTSSHPSELDDIKRWMPSSPPEMKHESLLIEKMDVPLFPRVREGYKRPMRVDNFNDIIGHYVPWVDSSKLVVDSPPPSPSASLLGQPPTVLSPSTSVLDDDDVDGRLERICNRNLGDLSHKYILEERLTQRDSWLMDVPRLSQPPFGCSKKPVYKELESLVIKADHSRSVSQHSQSEPQKPAGILKTVKGIFPLNLELSWRPFTYGTHMPTHVELGGVSSFIDDSTLAKEVEDTLVCVQQSLEVPRPKEKFSLYDDAALQATSITRKPNIFDDDIFLFTREERRRLATRSQDLSEPRINVSPPAPTIAKRPVVDPSVSDSPANTGIKRQRMDETTGFAHLQSSSSSFSDLMDFVPLHYDSQSLTQGRQEEDPSHDLILPLTPEDVSMYDPGVNMIVDGSEGDDLYVDDYTEQAIRAQMVAGQLDKSAFSYYESPSPLEVSVPPASRVDLTPMFPPAPVTETVNLIGRPSPPAETAGPDIDQLRLQVDRLSSAQDNLSKFMALRGVSTATRDQPSPMYKSSSDVVEAAIPHELEEDHVPMSSRPIPEELIRCAELAYAPPSNTPATIHRYIASLPLIQKHTLTHVIERDYGIELIERASLNKPDIIFDPFRCLLFCPLASLPSAADSFIDQLCLLSWCYTEITIVFESYSEWRSYRPAKDADQDAMEPDPFSPPVIKAVRRLRRGLGMKEGTREKDGRCHVSFGFARTVDEAGSLVRFAGEKAEREDASRMLWDGRAWLGIEEWEGEDELAANPSMNLFAAIVILARVDLANFLDALSKDRLRVFSELIGHERMLGLNAVIDERRLQFQSSSSPSF